VYSATFEQLERESGLQLEAPQVTQLRTAVLEGRWDMVSVHRFRHSLHSRDCCKEKPMQEGSAQRPIRDPCLPQASHLVSVLLPGGDACAGPGRDVQRALLEQRYRELLAAGDFVAAVALMRDRLVPMADSQEYTNQLAAYAHGLGGLRGAASIRAHIHMPFTAGASWRPWAQVGAGAGAGSRGPTSSAEYSVRV
jgi:hypothetical protein